MFRAVLCYACHAVLLQQGIMGVDPSLPSTITAFPPGYLDKEKEVVVGLQTDQPLKRSIKPRGGVNVVKAALQVGAAGSGCRLRDLGGGAQIPNPCLAGTYSKYSSSISTM